MENGADWKTKLIALNWCDHSYKVYLEASRKQYIQADSNISKTVELCTGLGHLV